MSRIRLIIADDNAALRAELAQEFSTYEDIELLGQASDGLEALSLCAAQEADVLLLDIIMPQMDGLNVLAELKKQEKAPRVLVFSAVGNDSVIARAMELGAAYYMIKPIRPSLLHRRILEVAELRRPQAEPPDDQPLPRPSADEQVANLFLTLGIPAHIKGYQYLREAVRMVMADPGVISRITKELYPGVARRYDTSSSKVERAMRHAIEVAWARGRLEAVNQMYGYRVFAPEDRPTNGEFIALVSDKISVKKTA